MSVIEFAGAIEIGDARQIRHFVGNSLVDVNERLLCYWGKPTPLIVAVRFNRLSIVKVLLRAGARINDIDDLGNTACFAIFGLNKSDQCQMLAVLLKYKPHLNSALLQKSLSIFDNDRVSLMLLQAGAPLDIVNTNYLFRFASTGTIAIRALLDRGVAVRDLRNEPGETLLHQIVRSDEDVIATLDLLVNTCGVDLEHRDRFDKRTCAHVAALHCKLDVLLWLINAGANVNAVNFCDTNMLHFSRYYMVLIAAGADVHKRNDHGRSPIHSLALSGDIAGVVALLSAGADLDARDCDGSSAREILAEKRLTIDWDQVVVARKEIAKKRLDFVRLRAFQLCIGLQSLSLPALQICDVLLFACGPIAPLIPFHQWWNIATTIKHFH
jgi:ankyrin repeat protein